MQHELSPTGCFQDSVVKHIVLLPPNKRMDVCVPTECSPSYSMLEIESRSHKLFKHSKHCLAGLANKQQHLHNNMGEAQIEGGCNDGSEFLASGRVPCMSTWSGMAHTSVSP